MAARGRMTWKNKIHTKHVFLFAMDYRTMTVGMARVTVFQEIRPGAGFKAGDFVKETLGGLP